jgi:general secretion pathway protein A
VHAFNAIAEQWGTRPIKVFSEGLDVPDMFRRIAARRNLRVTLFKGSLDNVIRFDLPFIVVTGITGELGEYCYAVTSAKNGSLSLSPSLLDSPTISRNDLASVASGTYYLVWQNFGQIPDSIVKGEKRFEVKALQRLLRQAGYYHDLIDGDYSTATAGAVREFQQSMGITENETLGELTLAALTRFDTNHMVPSLKGN